jgi:ribonuclease HII
MASHAEIDKINILQASLLSMKRAVESLSITPVAPSPDFFLPDFLLIDGKFSIDMDMDQEAVVKGDSKSISIAAASIIAKVTRDAVMRDLHRKYPEYNFVQHKGYPTTAHKQAILKYGPSPVHRLSFRGVKEAIHA